MSNVEDLQSTIKTYFESQECGEKSCAVKWSECKEAAGRAEVTKNSQDAVLAGYMIEGNYNISDCTSEKDVLSTQYTDVLNKKNELEKTQKDDSSDRWIIAVICLAVGALGYWFMGDSLRKHSAKKPPYEKNYSQLKDSETPSSRLDEALERAKSIVRKKEVPEYPEEETEEEPKVPFKKEVKKKESKGERLKRVLEELDDKEET